MAVVIGMQALVVGTVLVLAGVSKFAGGASLMIAGKSAFALLVPQRVLPWAWRALGALELLLGVLVLALPASRWVLVVATVQFAGAAAYAVWALLTAPERPCGCFGLASTLPATARTIVRATLLMVAAAGTAMFGAPWLNGLQTPAGWVVIAGELCILSYLSPEVRPFLPRRLAGGKGPDCVARDVPVEVIVAQVKKSVAWREFDVYLARTELREHWHDGCRAFLYFPAAYAGHSTTAMFIVQLERRHLQVRGALLDDSTQRVLLSVPAAT